MIDHRSLIIVPPTQGLSIGDVIAGCPGVEDVEDIEDVEDVEDVVVCRGVQVSVLSQDGRGVGVVQASRLPRLTRRRDVRVYRRHRKLPRCRGGPSIKVIVISHPIDQNPSNVRRPAERRDVLTMMVDDDDESVPGQMSVGV